MTMPSSEAIDSRARDVRIHELYRSGWAHELIAEEFGISRQRVGQILARVAADPEVQIAEHEAKLQGELEELVRHEEANRRRIRAVRRALERIDEEREARQIDRLLGLA